MGNFVRRITVFGPATLFVEAPVIGGPGRDTTVSIRSGGKRLDWNLVDFFVLYPVGQSRVPGVVTHLAVRYPGWRLGSPRFRLGHEKHRRASIWGGVDISLRCHTWDSG